MKIPITEAIDAVRLAVDTERGQGLTIGLVPTMGALHAGHASLLQAARRETGFVVASIFVNPTQFGPSEDFKTYPRDLEQDLDLCRREGVDLVFTPQTDTIYPSGFATFVDVQHLPERLCGRSRPGHFRGVATVVLKLLNIIAPDVAYFGQKDFQQCRIIQRLVEDLNLNVQIRMCPIVREPDGLAMSSRNRYLGLNQRRQAIVLNQALTAVRQAIEAGERDTERVRQLLRTRIESAAGIRVDYAELVDPETLEPLGRIEGHILAAVAAYFGPTRLIDNVLIKAP